MILNFLSRDAIPPGETGTVAFLTPKRLGAATVRNRLRRRMREICRRELVQPRETAYLIWIARQPAVELSFEELKLVMRELATRAGTAIINHKDHREHKGR
jgi:ribonuclease P protein component